MYNSGARKFEDVVTQSYLAAKPSEKKGQTWFEVYDDYGGFATIEELMDECASAGSAANDEYHFSEIRKYEIL